MKLTVNNYKEAVKDLDFSKLPEVAKETHEEFDNFAVFYDNDKDIKEMLDSHFKIVEKHLKSTGAKKSTTKKAANKTKQAKTKTKKATCTRKAATPRQAKRKANEVDLMPMEIKVIRRYLKFHGKRVTERQVSLLYKVIQKAATEKTIRKSSKYATEINKIGNDLAQTYKEMEDACTFEVPQALYTKLKAIMESYGITPAVALIKRFVNLYNNITQDKAKRLLISIRNALKNGKVSQKDEEYEQVKKVQKHLNDYLNSDKLLVTKVELQGLQGLAGLGK